MTDTQLPAGPPRRHGMGGPGQPATQPTIGDSDLATLAGLAAVVFPLVYFASELVEVAQGNFTTGRLALTYIGEAGIVFHEREGHVDAEPADARSEPVVHDRTQRRAVGTRAFGVGALPPGLTGLLPGVAEVQCRLEAEEVRQVTTRAGARRGDESPGSRPPPGSAQMYRWSRGSLADATNHGWVSAVCPGTRSSSSLIPRARAWLASLARSLLSPYRGSMVK